MLAAGYLTCYSPINSPIPCTRNAAAHAITHCPTTTTAVHFPPSSRLIDATAATHGVYKRQNTNNEAAVNGVSMLNNIVFDGMSTDNVDTTLSFAINPVISAVEILQSPNPNGLKIGAIIPATEARILFWESATILKCKSNVCKVQITIVAIKIMVKAL